MNLNTTCCVTGGGPAGMMLGLLLARAGVEVIVLEKHEDFLRDFRGDTVHPSTLEILHEIGLLEDFLKRPHQKVETLSGFVGGVEHPIADFRALKARCPFLVFMPQWDFLDFLAEHARRSPSFRLIVRAEVTDLLEEDGKIVGVRATTPDGPLEVRAALTVGADGRHSTVRARAGLPVENIGAPMDVLWMRLSRREDEGDQALGRFDRGRIFIQINRGGYWQCGFVIPKGGTDALRSQGIAAFRDQVAAVAPSLRDRVGELRDWDDVKLLTVAVDRLRAWQRPGVLCIGDSAHAMSPVGGVGINLAIQDAVAASNLLAAPLLEGRLTIDDLKKVQRRRELPTKIIQRLQVLVQNRVIAPAIGDRVRDRGGDADRGPVSTPWLLRLLKRFPILRRVPARVIGIGFRPEHVRTAEAVVGTSEQEKAPVS